MLLSVYGIIQLKRKRRIPRYIPNVTPCHSLFNYTHGLSPHHLWATAKPPTWPPGRHPCPSAQTEAFLNRNIILPLTLKFLTQQNPPQVLSSRLQLLQLKLPLHPGLTELQPRWLPSCLRYTKLPATSEPLHLLYLLPNLLPATAPSMFKSEVHVTFSEKFILHQNG